MTNNVKVSRGDNRWEVRAMRGHMAGWLWVEPTFYAAVRTAQLIAETLYPVVGCVEVMQVSSTAWFARCRRCMWSSGHDNRTLAISAAVPHAEGHESEER